MLVAGRRASRAVTVGRRESMITGPSALLAGLATLAVNGRRPSEVGRRTINARSVRTVGRRAGTVAVRVG
jgi:hypothetical protein